MTQPPNRAQSTGNLLIALGKGVFAIGFLILWIPIAYVLLAAFVLH